MNTTSELIRLDERLDKLEAENAKLREGLVKMASIAHDLYALVKLNRQGTDILAKAIGLIQEQLVKEAVGGHRN